MNLTEILAEQLGIGQHQAWGGALLVSGNAE